LKTKAFDSASGIQLHSYGRGLQFQKKQEEGFAIFRVNVKKHPNECIRTEELARMLPRREILRRPARK